MNPDLTEAVHALTQPRVEQVAADEGQHVVVHEPLLVQLENAIRSSIGGTVGGASLAAERNLLDSDALFEFMKITEQIRSWCRLVGVKPTRVPADDLWAWHDAFDGSGEFYVSQLREWAKTIRGKLDGGKPFELTAACPECSTLTWVDGEGVQRPRPLVLSYQEDAPLETATVVCRSESCLAVWSGEFAIRLLRAQIGNDPSALIAFLRNS